MLLELNGRLFSRKKANRTKSVPSTTYNLSRPKNISVMDIQMDGQTDNKEVFTTCQSADTGGT